MAIGHQRDIELLVSLRIQPQGFWARSGPRNIHLDIVDYPEWLLDLGLIDQDYRDWSEKAYRRRGGLAVDP